MSTKYPGGFIKATAPVPAGGYEGSAPGIWTLEQAAWYQKNGMWPKPSDLRLWSWGYNAQGELGLGNITNYSSPKQVGALTTWLNVAAGNYHSLAIKTDGTLWVWGASNFGCLGLGNLTDYSSPKQVGALTTWLNITAGRYHSLAIKTDGTLWGWGRNSSGQLGLNNITEHTSELQSLRHLVCRLLLEKKNEKTL